MKRLIIITVLILLAAVTSVAGIQYLNLSVEFPSRLDIQTLDEKTIQDALARGEPHDMLVEFYVDGRFYMDRGYILDDGVCFLEEVINTDAAKQRIESEKQGGVVKNYSPEYFALLQDAPEGNYSGCYKCPLSQNGLLEFVRLLADGDINMQLSYEFFNTGGKHITTLYIGNRVAGYIGEFNTGRWGEHISPLENINMGIYQYIVNKLIPEIKSGGLEFDSKEDYEKELINGLKRYPFVIMRDRENPNPPISGDISTWNK